MKLLPKAQRSEVLRESHTIRWVGIGFVLTVLETIAQIVGPDVLPFPRWVVGIVFGVIFAGAAIARLRAKQELESEGTPKDAGGPDAEDS